MTLATKAAPTMTPAQRQGHNLSLALELAAKGYYVFPSNNKVPLCAVWQKADTSFTPAAREAEVIKATEKNGFMPLHVGSTIDAKVIKNLWRKYPDSVPSISCGPSNLFVIDADVNSGADGKRIKDGPARFAAWLAENEISMAGVFTVNTRSGGRHLYFKNTELLSSAAGILRDLDCDTRGVGGQTVAPGAVRVDGASYDIMGGMSLADLADTPETPVAIVTAARTQRETTTVTDKEVADRIERLEDATIESFDDIFDPIMGYDLDALATKDNEFAELRSKGTGDISRNRFKIARCLMREWPQMPVEHLLAFHGGWLLEDGTEGAGTFNDGSSKNGSGEYNFRDVSREHAKGLSEHKVSDGLSFGIVEDDEELADSPSRLIADEKIAEAVENERAAREHANGPMFTTDRDLIGDYKPKEWLTKKLIPLWGIGAVYGQPNSGKSFLIYDLLSRAARGMDFFGRKTKKRAGLYFNAEGVHTFVGRAKAWSDFHDGAPAGLVSVATNMPSFTKPNTARNEIEKIIDAVEAAHGEQVGVLVFDTWASLTAGLDENSPTTANTVTKELRKIIKKRGLCIIIVHHSTKGDSSNMRGTGALLGEIDFSFEVKETGGGVIEIVGHKQREEKKGAALSFKLKVIVIGKDEDGDDDTSCVVIPMNTPSRADAMTTVDEVDDNAVRFRVPDDQRTNDAAIVEILTAIAETTLMPGERPNEMTIPQRDVLIDWNKWRAERNDLDGVPLKRCDNTQLNRVVSRLVAKGSVVRIEREKPSKLRLI